MPLGEDLAELNGLYIHRMCLTLSFVEVICSGRLRVWIYFRSGSKALEFIERIEFSFFSGFKCFQF